VDRFAVRSIDMPVSWKGGRCGRWWSPAPRVDQRTGPGRKIRAQCLEGGINRERDDGKDAGFQIAIRELLEDSAAQGGLEKIVRRSSRMSTLTGMERTGPLEPAPPARPKENGMEQTAQNLNLNRTTPRRIRGDAGHAVRLIDSWDSLSAGRM